MSGFEHAPSGALTRLYSFCAQSGCADGQQPVGGLVQAANGDLYGTTSAGGASTFGFVTGLGTVFRVTPSGTLTTLYSFYLQSGCADGEVPQAALVQATNGDFYGSTNNGGTVGFCPPQGFPTQPQGCIWEGGIPCLFLRWSSAAPAVASCGHPKVWIGRLPSSPRRRIWLSLTNISTRRVPKFVRLAKTDGIRPAAARSKETNDLLPPSYAPVLGVLEIVAGHVIPVHCA